jgi:transient-receptor-potential-like protein
LQSWQKVDINIAQFSPEITPLILAAHKNNYEIIKLLLDRGATLPQPHDVKCPCDDCIRKSIEDPLRHSLSRVREYRALASPSLIALSSTDPVSTAFQVKILRLLFNIIKSFKLNERLFKMFLFV